MKKVLSCLYQRASYFSRQRDNAIVWHDDKVRKIQTKNKMYTFN